MAESRTDNLLSQILGKLLKHTFLLLSVVLILVAILVLVFKDKENISFTVLLALGAAFLPLGIREGFFEDQIRSLFTKELADTGLKITEEIAGKLSSIVKTGVVKVFSRRAYGVEEFLANNFCPEDKKLDAKDKYLVIAGSSLKGLIGTPWLNNEEESDECQDGKGDEIKCKKKQDEKLNAGEEVKGKQDEKSDSKKKDKGKQNNNDDFWSTANEFRIKLVQALDESWRVRILMTHPAFGDLRAVAEVRTALPRNTFYTAVSSMS